MSTRTYKQQNATKSEMPIFSIEFLGICKFISVNAKHFSPLHELRTVTALAGKYAVTHSVTVS